MRTTFSALLIAAALSAPAFGQGYWRGIQRQPQQRTYVQQNYQRPYYQSQRLRQPEMFGYSYGPGYYSSAFSPSPIFVQPTVVVDPYGYGVGYGY